VIAALCQHDDYKTFGKTKAGTPRYRCPACGKCFTDSTSMFNGMRIGLDKATQIIEMLCEGSSVSATARITRTDPHTILDLLVLVGERCDKFMAENIKGVRRRHPDRRNLAVRPVKERHGEA